MFSKNIFINYFKKSLVKRGRKDRIEVLEVVKAFLFLILDFFAWFWLANLSCFPEIFTWKLIKSFRQGWNLKTIVKKSQNRIFLKKLSDLLNMELFKIIT